MPMLSDRLDKLRRETLDIVVAAHQHTGVTHLILTVAAV
jgi:hypothetical protein